MGFICPWGCTDKPPDLSVKDYGMHETVWECPKFTERFVTALEGIANNRRKETR